MDVRIEKTIRSIWLAVLVWGVVTLVSPFLFAFIHRIPMLNILLDMTVLKSVILIVLANYNLQIWK